VIATPVLLSVAVLGLAWAVSGVAMALRDRATPAAAALTLAGTATIGGTLLDASGRGDLAHLLLVLGWALAMPLAVTAFPRLLWRHPVDAVALTTVVAAGILAVIQPKSSAVLNATAVVIGSVLVAHTWWRLERGDEPTRRALAWPAVVGAGAGLIGLLVTFLAPTDGGLVVVALAFALVGPAMFVGATHPDVVDVRVVVVQLVVVAAVLLGYISLFTLMASLLEVILHRPATVAELAVAGALATLPLPAMRTALRGVVDELLFGQRSDPLDAATHVADHAAGDPVLALRAVREALTLPYAVLRVAGETVASSGVSTTSTTTVPLSLGPDAVGELEVGLRPGDVALSRDDEHVLALVAPLLALTARSGALAAALQESREQSVTAIEEERRRLRRDLHDGLGPRLSGIAFTADAARNSVRSDPATAEHLLARLRAETSTAIEEIRGLVYAMRPPALDELGLVRAIRQEALALRTREGAPLRLTLDAPDTLPPLSAAVEVAAYRIVVESLTNAARHSGSDTASARLTADADALTIEVRDGGVGRTGRWATGVGVSSMRERAAEIGGSIEVGPSPTGGLVRARLPLAAKVGS
jgi:two-component system NarL family sensor kinase